MSLKNKILLITFSVSLLPIFIMSFATTRILTNLIIEHEVENKINILKAVSENVYSAIQERQLVGIHVLLNTHIQTLLNQDTSANFSSAKKENLYLEIEKVLQDYYYRSGTESLYLFSSNGDRYTNSRTSPYQLADFADHEWFIEAERDRKSVFWGDPLIQGNSMTIPLVRVIREITVPVTKGYLISTVKESFIANQYENFVTEGVSDYYIVNERGIILSHNEKSKIGKSFNDVFSNYHANISQEEYSYININSSKYLLIHYFDKRTGWTFFNSVPENIVKRGAKYIRVITYVLSGILIIISLIVSYLLTRNIIQPLQLLAERMEKAQNGDWDVTIETTNTDEIGKLERSFDVMIRELKKAFVNMIAIQEQKRKAELKVLEFQINPHFLYNTMSTIIWLSEMHENDAVIRVAESLSELFRISISKGHEIISVREELAHVQHYIAIQKVRYSDEFQVEYSINDRVLNMNTIKLILQPLVENSIYHGIRPNNKLGFSGIIRISGELKTTGEIVFHVIDNGIGLNQQEVERLNLFLTNKDNNESFGVGIRNVHDRIQLSYGSDYGIQFIYDPGYTMVQVTIPGSDN